MGSGHGCSNRSRTARRETGRRPASASACRWWPGSRTSMVAGPGCRIGRAEAHRSGCSCPPPNGSLLGNDDAVETFDTPPYDRYWSKLALDCFVWLHEMANVPNGSAATDAKNWSPPVFETVVTAPFDHRYVRPTPVS